MRSVLTDLWERSRETMRRISLQILHDVVPGEPPLLTETNRMRMVSSRSSLASSAPIRVRVPSSAVSSDSDLVVFEVPSTTVQKSLDADASDAHLGRGTAESRGIVCVRKHLSFVASRCTYLQ